MAGFSRSGGSPSPPTINSRNVDAAHHLPLKAPSSRNACRTDIPLSNDSIRVRQWLRNSHHRLRAFLRRKLQTKVANSETGLGWVYLFWIYLPLQYGDTCLDSA